nr:MAG TPA: hypothetical protein [Caudoviricetes sp.]
MLIGSSSLLSIVCYIYMYSVFVYISSVFHYFLLG